MEQVLQLLHEAERARFQVAHPTAFTGPQSKPMATQKPAKRQRVRHWVIDGMQKLTVPVEVTVDIVCDGCLLVGHSAPLRCHVLGWDDTWAVCGAQRSRGEVHLCMLPTSELPHVTMSALRDIKQRSAAFRPYQDPVCTADDFVEAIFQRPAVNSVETHGREVPVLHIVNGPLAGYSCNKVRATARPRVSRTRGSRAETCRPCSESSTIK